MDKQKNNFIFKSCFLFLCLAFRGFEWDNKITKKVSMIIGVAEGPFNLGKCNYIGWSVTIKVGFIEFCDLRIVQQKNAYFPLLIAQVF